MHKKGAHQCTPLIYKSSYLLTTDLTLAYYFTTSLRMALVFSPVTRTKYAPQA